MLTVEQCSESGLFRHLSNHRPRSPLFQKYIRYEGHLSFQNVQNLMCISRIEEKIQKKFLVF